MVLHPPLPSYNEIISHGTPVAVSVTPAAAIAPQASAWASEHQSGATSTTITTTTTQQPVNRVASACRPAWQTISGLHSTSVYVTRDVSVVGIPSEVKRISRRGVRQSPRNSVGENLAKSWRGWRLRLIRFALPDGNLLQWRQNI